MTLLFSISSIPYVKYFRYKYGAYITTQAGAEMSANYQIRHTCWNALGVALRRFAGTAMAEENDESVSYFDMSERCYLWAFACIMPYAKDDRKFQLVQRFDYSDLQQTVQNNLSSCLSLRHKTSRSNLKASRSGMKDQRRRGKKNAKKQNITKSMVPSATGMVPDGQDDIAWSSACSHCGVTKCSDGKKLKRCSGCKKC